MGVTTTSVISFFPSKSSGKVKSNSQIIVLTGYETVTELRQIAKDACLQSDISTADIVRQELEGGPYVGLSFFSKRHLPINSVIDSLNCTRDLGLLIRRINYVAFPG